MFFNHPIIDLHTHLRGKIAKHTKIVKQCGIDCVVYMANQASPLDNLVAILRSRQQTRFCQALPVSAITRNLAGQELVDVARIRPYVVGFSDDGRYLADLKLLAKILGQGVLVLAHCCPLYEVAVKQSYLETQYIKNYLRVLAKTGGRLHIQHVSQASSVALIRQAKQRGLKFTCETCPHYFTYTKDDLDVRVNPPLGLARDVAAIRQGLADGTIDIIASDYAPLPRQTGIANWPAFLALSYGLVLHGVLTKQQLKEKLFLNPKRIIDGFRF